MESFDWQIAGIPLHPLFVHGVVVIVPLAALMLALTAVWPAAARKLTFLTPAMAGVGLILAFLAHTSGEWLSERVRESPALAEHMEYAELMNPLAVLLAAVAVALWWWQRRLTSDRPASRGTRRTVSLVLTVLSVGIAVATLVVIVLVGDAGARATWVG